MFDRADIVEMSGNATNRDLAFGPAIRYGDG